MCLYSTYYIYTHTKSVPGVYTRVLTQYILTYIAQVYMLCTVYSHMDTEHRYLYMCTGHTTYFYVNTIQLYEHMPTFAQ